MAIRGDEPLKVMQRAGHEDLKTTMGYVREAENLLHALGSEDVFRISSAPYFGSTPSEGPAAWANLRTSQWNQVASPADSNPRNSLERAGSWA